MALQQRRRFRSDDAPRAQGGFSLLELMIVVIFVALLVTFAIDRLIGLQVDAERVQMQRVLSTLQSAARMELAEIIVQGDKGRLARWHRANPMALLEEPPPNYRGETPAGEQESEIRPAGQWYFRDGYLYYAVENERYFESSGPEGAVRFQLRVRYDDLNGDNRFNAGVDHPRALVVETVDEYRWLREPVAPAVAEMVPLGQSGS